MLVCPAVHMHINRHDSVSLTTLLPYYLVVTHYTMVTMAGNGGSWGSAGHDKSRPTQLSVRIPELAHTITIIITIKV